MERVVRTRRWGAGSGHPSRVSHVARRLASGLLRAPASYGFRAVRLHITGIAAAFDVSTGSQATNESLNLALVSRARQLRLAKPGNTW